MSTHKPKRRRILSARKPARKRRSLFTDLVRAVGLNKEDVRATLKQAANTGADVAVTALDLVEETVRGARSSGRDAARAANEVANSAVDAAQEIGGDAATRVRNRLRGTVAGIRLAIKDSL